MSKRRQSGFSLLELLVAMMIIAVLGTLGFTQFRKHTAKARYIKSQDSLRVVSKGLADYYLRNGYFPELSSFEAMVAPNSPLVKLSLIPVNVPSKDSWNQPFEGTSSKGAYVLKCAGDPANPEDYPPFSESPDKISGQESKTPGAGLDGPKDGPKTEGTK